MEKTARPDAVLATNTSSIDLEVISGSMKKPGRLIGLHFFNPVAKMQLVEVVYSDSTFKKTRELATTFSVQIGRLPVAVKSGPGFLVNRVLMPYTLEGLACQVSKLWRVKCNRGACPASADRPSSGEKLRPLFTMGNGYSAPFSLY